MRIQNYEWTASTMYKVKEFNLNKKRFSQLQELKNVTLNIKDP